MNLWGWLNGNIWNFARNGGGGANLPTTMSPTVERWQPEMFLCRTLYGGWETVAANCRAFLPIHPKEDPQDYYIRVKRPTFYNAFARTVHALAGTVFKVPPEPQGIPEEIQALYDDDIDLQGTEGNAFLLHTFTDALITGLAGIFVDMPKNTGGLTRLEAQQLDIRPYWTLVPKDAIVSFRTDVVNGKSVLGQLVFKQCVHEPMGEFGVQVYDRLRVFRRTDTGVAFEAWEQTGKSSRFKLVEGPEEFRGVTEIPFAPIYTARRDFMDATPPLIDVANLNLLHYQLNSDLHHAAHIANVPFLCVIGADVDSLVVGPNRAVGIPGKPDEVNLKWMETTGASLGSTRAILADLEEQISNLGLGMLQRNSRAAETAQKAALDRLEQDSTLAAIVSDLENGIELALYYTSQFMGLDTWGRFEFTRDFTIDPGAVARTQNQGAAGSPPDPKRPGETNNPQTSMVGA